MNTRRQTEGNALHEALLFYCGIGEQQWNHHPVSPGSLACISPVYGNTTQTRQVNRVRVPSLTHIIQDSGAFSDGPGQRLSFHEALKRQETHAQRFGYADQIEARASYDLLIDEMWDEDGTCGGMTRTKRRWTETQADLAVQETIQAAAYLSRHRNGLPCILSAQGVSPQQYRHCAEGILPSLHHGDLLGLGGWCITGKLPGQMLPVFRETMHLIIPFLGKEGITRVHIWGVCYAPALGELLWLCDQLGITLSTDSMGPQVRPTRGRWGYAEWTDRHYRRVQADSEREGVVNAWDGSLVRIREARGLHRAEHVQQVRSWLGHFRGTSHYPAEEPRWLRQPRQLLLAL